MHDAYLKIARNVLLEARVPLRARTILRIAQEAGTLPRHLWGKTQHKTLGARLSEHILKYGEHAQFYRTAPGLFFLRELVDDPTISAQHKRAIRTRRRAKELQRETVLSIPKRALDEAGLHGFIDPELVLMLMREGFVSYLERKRAERDYTVKQVVTYIIALRGREVLSYRRGRFSNANDEILGARSIGFGGHVADMDVDLWSPEMFGIPNNCVRELYEELDLTRDPRSHAQGLFSLCSFLNVDETDEAQRHIAAVVIYHCPPTFEPRKRELSINDLCWLPLKSRPNHFDDFELWSRLLLDRFFHQDFWRFIQSTRQQRAWSAHY